MRLKLRLLLLPLMMLPLCGLSKQDSSTLGQPLEERKAQDKLPKSKDPMWVLLAKTKIHLEEKKGLYSAAYPDEVKALVGTQVTISGFMLPLEATEKFKHFIISKRTPTCPFCPPGEPNEIADVWLETPVKWSEDVVKVTGTFELMNNAQLGMFFKITKAKIL